MSYEDKNEQDQKNSFDASVLYPIFWNGLIIALVLAGFALFLFLTAVPVYYGGYWMAWDNESTIAIEGERYLWTDVVSEMTWWEWYTQKPMFGRLFAHVWIICIFLGGIGNAIYGDGKKKR